MSQKTDLQSNNTDLQAILATINALPDAGGSGGTLETVTITYNDRPDPDSGVYYVDETLQLHFITLYKGISFSVLKNSILVVTYLTNSSFPSCAYLCGPGAARVFQVTG